MILKLSIPVGVATPRSCSTEKKQLCIVSAVTPWVVLVDNLLLVSEHGEDFVFPWLALANSLDHVCELGRQYAGTLLFIRTGRARQKSQPVLLKFIGLSETRRAAAWYLEVGYLIGAGVVMLSILIPDPG
jgi:hypothetical protein